MKPSAEIILPERDYSTGYGSYGDIKMAAGYCGLSCVPQDIAGEWQHGWICPERNIHPEFVIGSDGRSRERKATSSFFVARNDQVNYLKSRGFRRVYAVGLPIIYVPKPSVSRIAGSLLVMPTHSLPETTEKWDADEYAQYIRSIAHRFSSVHLCVHKACYDKGNWMDAFTTHNIDVIAGADEKDQNSLLRIANLFSQFEFVTTNEFGSQVAYASYFGCKVSVCGPRSSWEKSDYKNLIFYQNAPELLDVVALWRKNRVLETAYPQFVCHPWKSSLNVGWASEQLGQGNMRTQRQLKSLFGWSIGGRSKRLISKFSRKIMQNMQSKLHRLRLKVFVCQFREEMKIPTHLTIEEKHTLFRYSSSLRKGSVCVEIGSYLGASACFIAAGIDETSQLYCIDTWQNDAMAYTKEEKNDERLKPQDTYKVFRMNTQKYKNKINEIRGNSCKVVDVLKDKKIMVDLLFIDGDHDYNGVMNDWLSYKNMLTHGSLVVFHDTGWAEGVNKVIAEYVMPNGCLIEKMPNLEIYRIN